MRDFIIIFVSYFIGKMITFIPGFPNGLVFVTAFIFGMTAKALIDFWDEDKENESYE